MKLTLSVIKADIGSIGGHVAPSRRLQETVKAFIRERAPRAAHARHADICIWPSPM